MDTKVEIRDKEACIYVSPDTFKSALNSVSKEIEGAAVTKIKADLKDCFYFGSEDLGCIVSLKKLSDSKKIPLVLLNVHEGVYESLVMTNLDQQFKMENDFSNYSTDELVEMFHDDSAVEAVCDFMVENYSKYKELLLKLAVSDDAESSTAAILTIGRAQDNDAADTIKKALQSPYSNVVRAAVQALGWLWDSSSKDTFYNLILSEDKGVSEAAGAAYAMVSDEGDVAQLKKIADNSLANVREVVSSALSLINGEDAFAVLKDMFVKEKDPAVRKAMVKMISFFNIPEATEKLVTLLDDSDSGIQEAAAAGLQRTGLRGHESAVLAKALSGNTWISYFAVKALSTNCSDESAKKIIEIYPKEGDNVKLAIIEALSSSKVATDFLASQLASDNEDIRKESLSALAKIAPEGAVKTAFDVLAKDASWIVRYKALEIIESVKPSGYKDLLGKITDSNKYVQAKIQKILGE